LDIDDLNVEHVEPGLLGAIHVNLKEGNRGHLRGEVNGGAGDDVRSVQEADGRVETVVHQIPGALKYLLLVIGRRHAADEIGEVFVRMFDSEVKANVLEDGAFALEHELTLRFVGRRVAR